MPKATFIFLFICRLSTECFSQVQTFYVKPVQTDAAYSATEDSNYVARNTTKHVNRLVLFIGGSTSSPKHYATFTQHAASLGFDAISLSYPNKIATTNLIHIPDTLVFDKFRQEICFGTPVSVHVSVDSLNAIHTRTLKLIRHLASTYPSQGWGQYLASPTTLNWTKIIVSGHSQGSGHACYLAKHFQVDRVLMFSGPNDFSTYYNNSARWLRLLGTTSIEKHVALLHALDDVVPFSRQFTNLKSLGMLHEDDSTLVDYLHPPYMNSRVLYTKIQAPSFHNSTVNDHLKLAAVWQYMLTSSIITSIPDDLQAQLAIRVYPNPAHADLLIVVPPSLKANSLFIYDSLGQLVLAKAIQNQTLIPINVSFLASGAYIVSCGGRIGRIVKE